jgi:hypothetical protein
MDDYPTFRRHLALGDANEPSGVDDYLRFRRHPTPRDANEPSGVDDDLKFRGHLTPWDANEVSGVANKPRLRTHLTPLDANEPSGVEDNVRFRRHRALRDGHEPQNDDEELRFRKHPTHAWVKEEWGALEIERVCEDPARRQATEPRERDPQAPARIGDRRIVVLLLSGAVATAVLFTTDAFFAFAGWRILVRKQSFGRECVKRAHAFTEKREPLFAAIAMASAVALALNAGVGHPRAACLAGGALVALAAHLRLYAKTSCLMRVFEAAPVGSAEWHSRAGRLEAAMVTRASLQAAAFICIVAAGMMAA